MKITKLRILNPKQYPGTPLERDTPKKIILISQFPTKPKVL